MSLKVEYRYFEEKNLIRMKPSGYIKTREDAKKMADQLEMIHTIPHRKFWLISDITHLRMDSLSLLQYFASLTRGLDRERLGTVFIITNTLQKTGIGLLSVFRKVNFYTAYDLESAMRIVDKLQTRGSQ
ncbi:MAG TPA: hypothetical protein PKV16_03335 [Caldisericia bacterium]|nr:hypothetical protein [Caldisericia bacterium]HPF48345.1 hypothetical protein [Caldisericia bacterium]HPI83476.1 hypothetical protein [Caldisericia bacterium]HPQ92798.1 hypothetical protein [Caldisericia bacterium]HRV74104.1 hypothetical protein [Caldisericia bacterium]